MFLMSLSFCKISCKFFASPVKKGAEETGLIAGDETGNKQYRNFLTREQFAVLLHRYDALRRGK